MIKSKYAKALAVMRCDPDGWNKRSKCKNKCCDGVSCVDWLKSEFQKLDALEELLQGDGGKYRVTFDRLKQLVDADCEKRIVILPYTVGTRIGDGELMSWDTVGLIRSLSGGPLYRKYSIDAEIFYKPED